MAVTGAVRVPGRPRRAPTTPTTAPARSEVAVGSAAIAAWLTGTPRPWRVVGSSTDGWWCTDDVSVLVFTVDRSVRLPNSVVIGAGDRPAGEAVARDDPVVVGNGLVACRSRCWRVVRWWDPRVAVVAADPADVLETLGAAATLVQLDGLEPLMTSLRASDHARFVEAAARLVGRGGGLTPEGDDVLAGVVAGYRHVGASIGIGGAATLLEQVRPAVLGCAAQATTLLSSSLLRHSFDGEVAAPVAALLHALTGRGELSAALAATRRIGHSSGAALAAGVVAGAASACGVLP